MPRNYLIQFRVETVTKGEDGGVKQTGVWGVTTERGRERENESNRGIRVNHVEHLA